MNNPLVLNHMDETYSTARFPYLTDHGVQGMVVLPGSTYISYGYTATVNSQSSPLIVLKDLKFENVFLLYENELKTLKIELKGYKEGETNFRAYSVDLETGIELTYAKSKIRHDAEAGFDTHQALSVVRERVNEKVSRMKFYENLKRNGNDYGPCFQGNLEIWRGEREALGKVLVPEDSVSSCESKLAINPALLDSCIQVLSATNENYGKTFILQSIEEIVFVNIPEGMLWSYAVLKEDTTVDDSKIIGDVLIVDDSDNLLVKMKGVCFQYINKKNLKETKKETVAISATFTAEPIQDSLAYWSRTLHIPFNLEMAPYNQIFQELYDPGSLLSKNTEGVNVLLIRFDDFIRYKIGRDESVKYKDIERFTKDQAVYKLPDGKDIVHLNAYETEYVYKEIFGDEVYLKHGITLKDGDCIFDVGANIGLFALFVHERCKDAVVYSFEPAPVAYDCLKINTQLYAPEVSVFQCGISDEDKEIPFTFYRHSSVFSSYNARLDEDASSIRAVIQNMLNQSGTYDPETAEKYTNELMKGRLESETISCRMRTISSIIRESNVKAIDLLKIDVEKAELDVLKGIDEQHWKIIKQLVIEVHDSDGAVSKIVSDILRSKGFDVTAEEETLLHGSGLSNIYAIRQNVQIEEKNKNETINEHISVIEHSITELVEALKSAAERSKVPFIVATCPNAPDGESDRLFEFYGQLEQSLAKDIEGMNNIYYLPALEIQRLYPVETYYDAYGDKLGHVPFTPEFFTALGSAIARKIHNIKTAPYKVIALDCDQTLWKGICGEDAVDSIKIDGPYRMLQEFMVAQQKAGMLLCVCSKNSQEDVDAVFQYHVDMPLQKKHITASKINWLPKSYNLKDLSQELNLGLDSFIFIDDNPVECAEVQANCPDVLVVQLPDNPDRFQKFLMHIWAFDYLKVTETDKLRTVLYRQNVQRERSRAIAPSLKEFIHSLNIKVQIIDLKSDFLSRASQLTQRTNQFNFTTTRRSEAKIQELCRSPEYTCLVTKVTDRFGDYGIVGLIIYRSLSDKIIVDTFLLSCRVLGRGIEYQMLREVGVNAHEQGISQVKVIYKPTPKNAPALAYLEAIGRDYKESISENPVFNFPSSYIAGLTFSPVQESEYVDTENVQTSGGKARQKISQYSPIDSELYRYIATKLSSPKQILGHARRYTKQLRPEHLGQYIAPSNELERTITRIWQNVLAIEKIGIHDNFFDVGGDSMLAMQIVMQANQEGFRMTTRQFFENQTVAELAFLTREAPETDAEQGLVMGRVPLTPSLHRYLHERQSPDPHHWNSSILLESKRPLEPELLEKVVSSLLRHHDTLRLSFTQSRAVWEQRIVGFVSNTCIECVDISKLGEVEQKAEIESKAAQSQISFNLSEGPLLKIVHFDLGDNKPHRLLVVIHHFAIDGLSWGVFLQDLENAYLQISEGDKIQLPAKTTSYKRWAELIKQYAQSQGLRKELNYWRGLPWKNIRALPMDYPESVNNNTNGSARVVSVFLTGTETQKLNSLGKLYRTTDVLITTLVKALSLWTKQRTLLIETMEHGRDTIDDNVDLSRTLGFFIFYRSILITLEDSATQSKILESVIEQIRCIPGNGTGYDLLRYLCEDTEVTQEFTALPRAQVLFNYLGKRTGTFSEDSIFRPALESMGPQHSPRGIRYYPLAILGEVCDDRLNIRLIYSENQYKRATMETLAQTFLQVLQQLIASDRSSGIRKQSKV